MSNTHRVTVELPSSLGVASRHSYCFQYFCSQNDRITRRVILRTALSLKTSSVHVTRLQPQCGTPQNFYHPHFSVVVSAKCSELAQHLRLIGSGSFNLKKSAKKSEDVCVSFSVCGVKWLFRQRRVNSRPFKVNVIYTSFILLTSLHVTTRKVLYGARII